ncbi:hypothetical protein TNCV_1199811 [Trichonephila clavipes]|uniref:Uncharacterized protein n=1 Tax=Trichonephila clavipes TaxID=2585209 RepID=A0A8X6SBX7_TRICX|nr:hypothetical protein TNCV_1199811 [Trichonephila clavipes]
MNTNGPVVKRNRIVQFKSSTTLTWKLNGPTQRLASKSLGGTENCVRVWNPLTNTSNCPAERKSRKKQLNLQEVLDLLQNLPSKTSDVLTHDFSDEEIPGNKKETSLTVVAYDV